MAVSPLTIPTFTRPSSTGEVHYVPTAQLGQQNGIYAHIQVLGIANTAEIPRPAALSHTLPAGHSTPNPNASTGLTEPHNTAMFQVDTGSWATVLPSSMVEAAVGHAIDWSAYAQYHPGSLQYSSDHKSEVGVWVPLELAFPDARLPDGSVPKTVVTALVRTDGGSAYMMGIGFNESYATNVTGTVLTPANNAVLNVDPMKSGQIPHSYMIDKDGIHLGWTVPQGGAGWTVQQLLPEVETHPLPAGSPKDWQDSLGTLTINGVTYTDVSMLFDTGTPAAFIHFAGASRRHDGAPGNHFAIAVAGQNGGISYAFVTGRGSPEEPSSISESDAKHGPTNFMNTGMNFFREYRYAYDADSGRLAFQAYGDQGTAAAAPKLALAADTGAPGDATTANASLSVTPGSQGTLLFKVDGGPISTTYDPASLKDGAHSVVVFTLDAAGEVSHATRLAFTLDRSAPASTTASFGFTMSEAQLSWQGGTVVLDGPDGSQSYLAGIGQYQFSDGPARAVPGLGLVHEDFFHPHTVHNGDGTGKHFFGLQMPSDQDLPYGSDSPSATVADPGQTQDRGAAPAEPHPTGAEAAPYYDLFG
jgi:hypothetical protein